MKRIVLLFSVVIGSSIIASPSNSNDDLGFYSGFCNSVTENGNWDIAWGNNDPQMYCILIAHRLSAFNSPIAATSSGLYDSFDMNKIEVKCQDEEHSFVIEDFGDYGIRKAVVRAKNMSSTHCVFKITPNSL